MDNSSEAEYEETPEENGVRVKSTIHVVNNHKSDMGSQTDLHNLSRDSTDLEWDDFIDKHYGDLGVDILTEWEKLCRDARAVRKWAKMKIQTKIWDFEDYSIHHTDPREFSTRKLKMLSVLDSISSVMDF